ncbi:hypothetical protein GKE82_17015 [Conexibacter sp. W3-3-2]|uniref:hypothetical protein n=1 Tax=Conexibacter sp. W3-3-2 TaxID=2675227 RepID=UPI0012B85FC8|nr:hypothetical protein [Conexibacter sp. W3-3-2]MTD45941.1 hypothetical protein [Conexibacter sp. W3-3-2]
MRPTLPAATVLAAAALAALPAAATAAPVVTTVDGPSADVRVGGGIDLAPDGTGILAYTKAVGGTDHVFVSRRAGGTWSAPVQLSAGTGAAAAVSEPKVAAFGTGGAVVAWRVGPGDGLLRAAVSPAAGQPFTTKDVVPLNVVRAFDLDAASDGSAYITFTQGANPNVRAAHLASPAGDWSLVGGGTAIDPSGILDRTAAEEAAGPGGQTESDVAAYPGGAVMTWTETDMGSFDVLARRLTGTTAGPVTELSVPTLDGRPRATLSDMTDVAATADGTAHVAFRELFTYGATDRPRVLVRRIAPDGTVAAPQVADGLPADPPEGAEFPSIAISPDGAQGLVASPRQLTFATFASRLEAGSWLTGTRADTGTPTAASTPVAAVGASGFGAVAWKDTPAGQDPVAMVASGTGATLGAPETLSVPGAGPVVSNDTETLTAAAQQDGSTAVLFAQGAPATRRIVLAQIPTTVVPPATTPTPTPGTPAPGTGPGNAPAPVRTTFGRTPRITLPATVVRRTGGRLRVTVRNREPFTVRATVLLRVRRGGRARDLVAPARLMLRAAATRSVTVRARGALARRVLRRGARVTLRVTVRAPRGTARTLARTVRVR